ncbi:MAG: hypothetical protein ACRC41_15150 [Sarcina sp.]
MKDEDEELEKINVDCDFDKIKNTVLKSIREYEKTNSLIRPENFDLGDITEEVLNNPINKEYISGIKNSLIIRTLVISAIDREFERKEDIIYKALFMRRVNTAAPNYDNRDGTFYFYIIFLKERCIIYQLTNKFCVIKISKYNKNDYKHYKYISTNQIFKINFEEHKNNIYLDSYTFRYNLSHKEDNNFDEFKKFIISQGFKEAIEEKEQITFTGKKLSYILLALLALLIINGVSTIVRDSSIFFILHR